MTSQQYERTTQHQTNLQLSRFRDAWVLIDRLVPIVDSIVAEQQLYTIDGTDELRVMHDTIRAKLAQLAYRMSKK